MSEEQIIEETLATSGLPGMDQIIARRGHDCAPEFAVANFHDGFGTPERRFRFAPDWAALGPNASGMPAMPDYWPAIDSATEAHPLRLVAAPARQFLNTSFTETPTARRMEKRPTALMHPDDMTRYDIIDGKAVTLGNAQAEVSLWAKSFEGLQQGSVVVESLWPNEDFIGGIGINALISDAPGQPNGGAVFHDTAIWAAPGQEVVAESAAQSVTETTR